MHVRRALRVFGKSHRLAHSPEEGKGCTTPSAGHKVDWGFCTIYVYIYVEDSNADRFMLSL